MKFSTATFLALASGAIAMPWSAGKFKNSDSNSLSTSEDITLRIKVSQAPMNTEETPVSKYDICWLVCWPNTPTCPDGWYSNNMGNANEPCWTCCKAPDDFHSGL